LEFPRFSERVLAFGVCLFLLAAASCAAAQEPAKGGVFRYAAIDEAPTLDQHVVTSDLATTIAQHIFEGLYTFDANYTPVPMLAESTDVQEDGKLVAIKLREGVKFHNGKELDAEDVVASLNRWGKFGTRGPVLFEHIAKLEADSKYVVKIYFKEPFAPWQNLLAFINGGPVIYPKEVVEKAEAKPIPETEYIGTGPYKFVERNPGRYILLARFDDYKGLVGPADGYAGERIAYFDEIRFIPVPDVGTRVNGVKAGDYDYAEQIPGDLFESLKSDSSVKTIVNQGCIQGFIFFNSKDGIMKDNYKLRQAILAATKMDMVLRAAIGPEELWDANGSFMPEVTPWYSKAGLEKYNRGDVELAKKLAKEAGYNGEKITFMVSSSYKMHYDSCMVIAKQLSEAGFNVDLQIYDWATLVSKRSDPKQWDMFFTHHGFVPDPILFTFMSDTYPGWWATEKKASLKKPFIETMDQSKRIEIWGKIQELIYEEVPVAKTGDIYMYDIYSPKVQGLSEMSLIWPKLWGLWFK